MASLKHARRGQPRRHEPYSTAAVIAVSLATVAVPLIALAGHGRAAVVWLSVEVALLAVVRLMRPDGTWIAARGRAFDVTFGVLLALGLASLSWYASLPGALTGMTR